MIQILHSLRTGEILLADVPCPAVREGTLLIRNRTSLVSAGTERMLLDFGKAGWIEKARKQPDKVRQVIEKIKTDGLLPTIDAVHSKLETPLALGYASHGHVIEVIGRNPRFRVGDRVISNGPHAEVVCVPENLCAKVPDDVGDAEAAFTVVGAIGLQGIRLTQPTLGEAVTVTGLGLIGLICVQLLQAHGCRVLGVDFDSAKCALARQFGAATVDLSKGEDPIAVGLDFSRGRGMDAVLITASTRSNDPVRQGARMCRKRGRIVLVGVTGLELSRADFYEKELSFQVSCSYGPGRYDDDYELRGRDYPFGFVRWTEQRNFEAVLDMLASKRLDVAPLISHRFPIAEALRAYSAVAEGRSLGVILEYPARQSEGRTASEARTVGFKNPSPSSVSNVVVGVIGAGNFSSRVLLPALARTGARLKTVVSASGVTARHAATRFGIEQCSTDADGVLEDSEINAVLIATRHDTHARYVIAGLRAGKRVFVEKPLCLSDEELREIEDAYRSASNPFVMVGFNRRFAPHIDTLKRLLDCRREPKVLIFTGNAGSIPATHWTQDEETGGGRIRGEACHFIDLVRHTAGSRILRAEAHYAPTKERDIATLQMELEGGSLATVHYLANGSKAIPKERLEVFCGGATIQLDNYRSMVGFGWRGFRKQNLWKQDKGHAAEMKVFVDAVREGAPCPIPFSEIVEVTRVTNALASGGVYPAVESESGGRSTEVRSEECREVG